jgi:protease PrsW
MINLVFLSLAPVLIILTYVYFRDKYEQEPWDLLLKAILMGVAITLPVVLVESFFVAVKPVMGVFGNAAYMSFLVAGLTEESFKFLALYILIWRNPEFNEKFDGIVYAVFVALGFAGVENILYVVQNGAGVGLIRALTAVPAHALFGVTMGYYFGIAHMVKEFRKPFLWQALLIPVFLHGIYDFILFSGSPLLITVFIPYLVWLYITGFRRMKLISDDSVFRDDQIEKDSVNNHIERY